MGFVNPWMLVGVVALGIPVLFHLWRKRRVVPKRWAAFRLLIDVEAHSHRAKVERWLLLALRMLALLLMVLAFARPTADVSLLGGGAGKQPHTVVILDNSHSMGRRVNDTTVFRLGRERLLEQLGSARFSPGTVLLMSDRPRQPFAGFTAQPTALSEAVAEAKLSQGATDGVAALRRAVALLRRSGRDEGTVLLYHDFQRSAWRTDELRRFDKELAGFGLSLGLFHLKPPEGAPDNQLVAALGWSSDVISPGMDIRLSVTLHNHADEERTRRLTLELDGVERHAQEVKIPAAKGGSPGVARVSIPLLLRQVGAHRGKVTLSPDALAIDNVRYFAREVIQPLRVLIVDGRPKLAAGRSPSFFAGQLLAQQVTGNVRSQVVPIWQLDRTKFSDYDTVVLAGVSRLSPEKFSELRRYLEKGGGVIYFLGEAVDRQAWLAAYTQRGKRKKGRIEVVPEGVFPGYPKRVVSAPAGGAFHFDAGSARFDHPLLRRFRNTELGAARFKRIFEFEPLDATSIPLRFDNGMPAIVARSYGAGRILVFCSSAGSVWNDMLMTASTTPLLLQAVYYCSGAVRAEQLNRIVGQPVEIPFPFDKFDRPVEVTRPDGKVLQLISRATRASRAVVTVDEPELAGVYQYAMKDGPHGFFAVNVDPRESDPRGIAPEKIAELLPAARVSTRAEQILGGPGAWTGDGWLLLMLIAIVVICSECWLANRNI